MYCLNCAYALSGVESRRCPECGTDFNPRNPRTFRAELRGPWWKSIWVRVPASFLAVFITGIGLIAAADLAGLADEMIAFLAGGVFLVPPLLRPTRGAWIIGVIGSIVGVLVFMAASVSHHTLGWLEAGLVSTVAFFGLAIAAAVIWSSDSRTARRWHLGICTVLALVFVPPGIHGYLRLQHLMFESARIMQFVEHHQRVHLEYPRTLADYEWTRPGLQKDITYYSWGASVQFSVFNAGSWYTIDPQFGIHHRND
jgi:hypothetical protein